MGVMKKLMLRASSVPSPGYKHSWRRLSVVVTATRLRLLARTTDSHSPAALSLGRQDTGLARNSAGFIPMIICIILVIVGVLYFAYTRVAQAQQ